MSKEPMDNVLSWNYYEIESLSEKEEDGSFNENIVFVLVRGSDDVQLLNDTQRVVSLLTPLKCVGCVTRWEDCVSNNFTTVYVCVCVYSLFLWCCFSYRVLGLYFDIATFIIRILASFMKWLL